MTSQRLTCVLCSHSGYDVQGRIVELEDPVLVEGVMERFRYERRCLDTEACEARQLVEEPT